jgi:phosphate transport system substrate-binding protein
MLLAALVGALVLSSLALVRSPQPASAGSPVTGAGSTFAQIAVDHWRVDAANQLGLTVDYQPAGSAVGRNFFASGLVDFAASDTSFQVGENTGARGFAYLPFVAGGTALMFNLRDTADQPIRDLRLDGPTIAKIFFREIRYWDDPAILDQNPHLVGRILGGSEIRPVARSGGAATTAALTSYLAKVAPDVWTRFATTYGIASASTLNFPAVPGVELQQGSDGVANFVANPNQGRGSIGYAEATFATQAGLRVVAVKNAASSYVYPTAYNVAVALLDAVRNPDGTQNLDGVYRNPRSAAYPISSYTYLIVPTDGLDPARGETLGAFVVYSVTAGQAKAADLGYSPLTPNLVQHALDQVARIPGAAPPPPLGDWGRFYEALAPPGTTTTTTGPGATTTGPSGGTTTTGPPGGTTTTTTAPTSTTTGPTTTTTGPSGSGVSLSVGDVTVTETRARGDWAAVRVPLVLSAPLAAPLVVNFATVPGVSSTVDVDYQSRAGTITIPAGKVAGHVVVFVKGDGHLEGPEWFSVSASVSGAPTVTVTDAVGRVTIRNAAIPPTGAVAAGSSVVVPEPDGSAALVWLPVTVQSKSPVEVTVGYSAVGLTATESSDFRPATGSVTVPAGASSFRVPVYVRGDTLDETDEVFTVALTGGFAYPSGAQIVVTIRDDANG